ncbi:MAG: hypothetical protein R3338_08765, partial [Thermoanaerobaculia bacterium]|nr:hypothetical protein [Thermoanaerobaculia bacterium]
AGPAVMTSVVFTWIVGLWLGWFLILSADVNAVVETATDVPAGLMSRFYFTGFSVVTLGIGDYKPGTGFAQIVTILASMSGFYVFTLAIAYAAPVLNAVVSNRHLSGYVTSLGATGEEILINAWDGKGLGTLEQHLTGLTSQILLMGRRYLAYPVLHYFHARDRSMEISLSLATLHDALMIIEHGIKDDVPISPATTRPLRKAFHALLRGERIQFADPAETSPPLPTLSILADHGIPVVDQSQFLERTEHLRNDRKTLLGFVDRRGWSWDDLQIQEEDEKKADPERNESRKP